MIERRFLPKFDEGDTLRLAVLTSFGNIQWRDAYQSTSSSTEDRYRLEASYWVTPLPRDGLLPLVCACPEIGLPETMTDVVLFPTWLSARLGLRRCGTSPRTLRALLSASTDPWFRVASAVALPLAPS